MPSVETLTRLQAIGDRVVRTDEAGDILLTSDGASYRVNEEISRQVIYLPLLVRPGPALQP